MNNFFGGVFVLWMLYVGVMVLSPQTAQEAIREITLEMFRESVRSGVESSSASKQFAAEHLDAVIEAGSLCMTEHVLHGMSKVDYVVSAASFTLADWRQELDEPQAQACMDVALANAAERLTQQDQPAPVQLVKQPQTSPPTLRPFLNREAYIANEDAEIFPFTVSATTDLKLVLDIENSVPLDVATFPGEFTKTQWLMASALSSGLGMLGDLAGDTSGDPFQNGLSKRAAFRRFESDWITAQAGTYTVVVDNSESYTPSRGDAVVRLHLYSR